KTSISSTTSSSDRFKNSASSTTEYNQTLPSDCPNIGAKTISPNNPYHQHTISTPKAPKVESKETLLIDLSAAEEDLPPGWSYSYDDAGTIYFFSESTGESQWEKPQLKKSKENMIDSTSLTDLVYDMNKMNLEALHPNWIRAQSSVQIKMISEKMEHSWKDYYAVLTTYGFVLIYKESLSNFSHRRPTSIKPILAYGTIDLRSFEITPATKSDTRKKFAFVVKNTAASVTIMLSLPNEAVYSEWSDAFMREKLAIKEQKQQQDASLIQMFASIAIHSKMSETVGRKKSITSPGDINNETHDNEAKSGTTLTRWFSRSNRNNKSQALSSATPSSSLATNEVFGRQLKLDENGDIPLIVRSCVEQVEKRGLDVVGIYRLSGQTTSIQKYKTQFNTNPQDVDLDQEHDINVITGLLKLYFRELKNPLLTFEYYDRLIEAARLQDHHERMFRLKSIIQVLPVANYKVFQYLIKHLEHVKNHSQVNKMEASNLALIFSVGLLRPKHDDVSASILHSDLASKVIECVLMHADWFFDTDTEDEDDASGFNNNSSVI
ncbi:Rho GTPase-activating protein 23, partial [Rhizopus stolonifer]